MTLSVSLRHRFPGFDLDAAFDAPTGVTALFGRSGSGKTTVINAVAGLLTPDEGRIVIDDTVLLDREQRIALPPHQRRIGYVFQDHRLFPHMTVLQNLLYGRRLAPDARAPGQPDPDRMIDLLGIRPLLDRRPGALSGGEKSRVAIGRAILSCPRLLLMDEPLAALDEARKTEILPYIERLHGELSLPILYVSHSVAEVARLATTIVLLDGGRLMAQGPATDLLGDPSTARLLGLREAGAILTGRLVEQEADGLSRLDTAAGPLWLPRIDAAPGTQVRLRILAQDVMIATARPEAISALNILPAIVADIRAGDGPGALVKLDAGGETLLSRITRRSATTLGLRPGLSVYAVLKAVSVAQENVGGGA